MTGIIDWRCWRESSPFSASQTLNARSRLINWHSCWCWLAKLGRALVAVAAVMVMEESVVTNMSKHLSKFIVFSKLVLFFDLFLVSSRVPTRLYMFCWALCCHAKSCLNNYQIIVFNGATFITTSVQMRVYLIFPLLAPLETLQY